MKHSKGFLALVHAAKKNVREIAPSAVLKRLEKRAETVVVDVREDLEWRAGHVAGAIHLGKGILERDIETTIPGKDTEIVLYCGGGFRSALATDSLQKMGYTNVLSMKGGWRKWNELEYPTSTKKKH